MNKNQLLEFYEELDDSAMDGTPRSQKRLTRKRESKKQETDARLFIRAQEIATSLNINGFRMSFEKSKLERRRLSTFAARVAGLTLR